MDGSSRCCFFVTGGLLTKQLIDPLISELTRSQTFLKQIVEGSTIPTFVIDHNHVVTHWNLACEKITGLTAKSVVGTENRAGLLSIRATGDGGCDN